MKRRTLLQLAAGTAAPTDTRVFPATLAGHAKLPALSLIAPPADAPRDLWVSGKFTGPARNDHPMSSSGHRSSSAAPRRSAMVCRRRRIWIRAACRWCVASRLGSPPGGSAAAAAAIQRGTQRGDRVDEARLHAGQDVQIGKYRLTYHPFPGTV